MKHQFYLQKHTTNSKSTEESMISGAGSANKMAPSVSAHQIHHPKKRSSVAISHSNPNMITLIEQDVHNNNNRSKAPGFASGQRQTNR